MAGIACPEARRERLPRGLRHQRGRNAERKVHPDHRVTALAQIRSYCGEARRSFGGKRLVLARREVRVPQLVELPAHVLALALAAGTKLFEVAERARRREPRPVRGGDGRARIQRSGIRVEQLGLRLGVQQRVLSVLAVDRDEPLADLAQLPRTDRAAVDSGCRAFADLALEDDRVERRRDRRPLGAVPDLVGAPARAKGEAQRVDEQRFAAAGFPGEEVQARPEANRGLRDQAEVVDVQLLQHARATSWGPAGVPSRASRPAGRRSSPAS